ncbi:unnamed protein product [Larinioides sclopetarius]|uniref:Uncharacterized protein n=2 Tax=Larinioides sclopetarius TaxID=280406 RepID=A0AAV2A2K0_9ARAC
MTDAQKMLISDIPVWVPPLRKVEAIYPWMKRSSPAVDPPPPPCALNSPADVGMLGSCPGKDERNYSSFPPSNRTASGRTPQHAQQPRQKREPQCMNQSWSNTAYDNSNASWESEWSAPSGTPPIKTDSTFYKNRNPGPYQSEWSPSDSSASNSVASSYGMMHTPQQSPSNSLSASSSSFYENNGFYNSGYGSYGQSAYIQPPYGQHQQYQPVRMADGTYSSNRNPSSCPPTPVKQPVPDYHRRQMRYGLDGMPKVQIKREPEEYGEMDGENFTSLFTKSLTSLYSQDTESAFSDESKPYDADIMACSTPTPAPPVEEPTGFQRLHPSSRGQYPANMSGDYPDARSNFGFYENRNQNCDPPSSVVQDIGSDGNQMNSFRYDRPSFDDMHLYASSSSESKAQAKKRKVSMPNIPPEGGFTENRKKAPRLMSFKSDSKWTPNSFAFSEIQIKQEPTDDFNTSELNGSNCNRTPGKDSSSGSMGNSNGGNGKTPSQQSDHPKPPPRKRSPGATCFDRFDKKSTPTNKKVSPLSVYAKVQENIVLNVKCRRYKKRTKPITNKEESACPGREEMENYKRSSLTPDQAAHQVMSELLERVCLFNERSVIDGPDLTQMDTMKVKELLMQFCHRHCLDYRDFEDVSSVLKTRIIKDKAAKNSERASAIRKRTSTSPVQPSHESETEPVSRTPKSEKGPKKSSHEDSTPAARRVLRKLPGRVDRSRPRRRADNKAPVVTRRYSTRSARDVEEVRGSDVDIVIDSSTDRESEAGKEAEVRKKSQRLKNKQPVVEMPARERSSEKARKNLKLKKEEPRTRSKEKKTEKPTDESSSKSVPKKKWTRLHMNCSDNLRSSSVEIVDITKSDSPSSSDSNDPFKKDPLSPSTIAEKVKCRSKRFVVDSKRNTSQRIIEKRLSSSTAIKKNSIETKNNKTSTVSDDTNRSSSRGIDDSSRGRKGTPKKLQTTSENNYPSKSLKKMATKKELEDSLSESDDSSKQPQSKKTRDSNSRTSSENKSKLLKADSKNSESEKSQTDRNKSPKLLKERAKRAFSNLSPAEPSSCPKVSNENIKKQTRDSSLSETDSSSSSKQTKENNKKSVLVKSEPDSKKSATAKDDSRNQMSAKNSSKDSSGKTEKSSDSFSACLLKKIKKEPEADEVIPATLKQEDLPSKPAPPVTTNPQNVQQEDKSARVVRNLPIKKIPRRRSSQHSESELQVVLTKLPDSQVSLSNGSVPVEIVRMCEQQSRIAQINFTESKIPQSNSDVGKPPELMRLKESNTAENQPNSSSSKDHSQDQSVSSPPNCTPVSLAKEMPPVDKAISKPQTNDRYSESEDSDCGLVIDLDRRQSVEERVPSPTFQNSEKSDDTSKSNKPEGPSAESLLKEPSLSAKAALEASKKATEDACLLLHLSRSAVPPIPNSMKEIPPIITSLPPIDTKTIEKPLPDLKEQNSKEPKETDRDESILRTLLLETGDVASGSSQAGPSTISSDSKAKLNQDVMKLLMYQTCQEVAARNPASEFDEKKIPLEQLTTDMNANLLSEAEDWGNDPVTIKEKVKKLKNEIACLQFLAEQKDKERIAILCFKRYKEEVLKRLKIMDHIRDWVNERYKSPSEERSPSDPNQPVATTSTAHNSITNEADDHPRLSPTRQVIQLAYHATVKTDVPTASVTSGENLTSQCGEKLPAVATMIANATENYGVDMRTVSRNSSTTKTIVQEVVSSRESIYSPAACGSPLSQEQRIGESVQIFQKTMSTTRESTFSPSHSRSPSLPELSPGGKSTHHFTKRVFSCSSSSSQSPPSLQPELRPTVGSSFTTTSSSFQPHYPLSLVVSASDTKTESSKTLHISSSSGKSLTEAPKNSPRSSPKRNSSSSYSVWSSVHTGRSSSAAVDLHTDRIGVQETSTKRTTTASHSLMVAPPPTTILQSTLKHPIHQRPRSEASHDRPLKNPVEKIFHHKPEETMRWPDHSRVCLGRQYNSSPSSSYT